MAGGGALSRAVPVSSLALGRLLGRGRGYPSLPVSNGFFFTDCLKSFQPPAGLESSARQKLQNLRKGPHSGRTSSKRVSSALRAAREALAACSLQLAAWSLQLAAGSWQLSSALFVSRQHESWKRVFSRGVPGPRPSARCPPVNEKWRDQRLVKGRAGESGFCMGPPPGSAPPERAPIRGEDIDCRG